MVIFNDNDLHDIQIINNIGLGQGNCKPGDIILRNFHVPLQRKIYFRKSKIICTDLGLEAGLETLLRESHVPIVNNICV